MPLPLSFLIPHKQPSNRCRGQDVLPIPVQCRKVDQPHLTLSHHCSAQSCSSVRLPATCFNATFDFDLIRSYLTNAAVLSFMLQRLLEETVPVKKFPHNAKEPSCNKEV